MKMKLTTLLFGLLLAVGWTSSASAQALPQSNIAKRFTYKPMAVTPVIAKEGMRDDAQEPCGATYSASSIKDLKYTWTDASNVTHESPYVVLNDEGKYEAELVTDPYQMYGLLRGVYMEKKLPGPLTLPMTHWVISPSQYPMTIPERGIGDGYILIIPF